MNKNTIRLFDLQQGATGLRLVTRDSDLHIKYNQRGEIMTRKIHLHVYKKPDRTKLSWVNCAWTYIQLNKVLNLSSVLKLE